MPVMPRRMPQHGMLGRKFRKSGVLHAFNATTITAGGVYVFSLDDRFKPYDRSSIVNLSAYDVEIVVNNQESQSLPAGTSAVIPDYLRDLKINNTSSGSIIARQIILDYENTGHEGDSVKSLAKTVGQAGLFAWGLFRR